LSYAELKAGAEAVAAALVGAASKPRKPWRSCCPPARLFLQLPRHPDCGRNPGTDLSAAAAGQLETHAPPCGILANAQVAMMITVPEAKPVALLLRAQVRRCAACDPGRVRAGRTLELRPR